MLEKLKKTGSALLAFCMSLMILTSCSEGAVDNSSKTETTTAKTEVTTSAEESSSETESSESEPESSLADESSLNDSSIDEKDKEPSDITPAMWTVTDKDGKAMTLMGSMHALTEECYPLPEKVQQAYDNADTLAVECDIVNMKTDLESSMAMMNKMVYNDNTTLKDHISEKSYNALKKYLKEYDMDIEMFKTYKPWGVFSTIESLALMDTELDSTLGIDNYLLQKAHEDKKDIYECESVDFQMDLLMNFSDDIYDVLFLNYGKATKKAQTENLMKMYEYWKTGDIKKLEKMGDEEIDSDIKLTKKQKKAYEEYEKKMLSDRNKTMEKSIKELFQDGKNAFLVVGAMHFVGEDGIIALLEKDGYKVEQVKY